MKEITVLNNQSLFDISVQEYGTIEGVFEIAAANGLGVTDLLAPGQRLVIPEINEDLISPEIIDYYNRNDIHPVTGDYDLPLIIFERQNFDDMKIMFGWGYRNYDGTPLITNVNQLYNGEDADGRPVRKHLLRIHLTDPDFIGAVTDPVLFIDRRRRQSGPHDGFSPRLNGYTHPKPEDWHGRMFELPLVAQNQIIDLHIENFFSWRSDNPYLIKARGESLSSFGVHNRYAYVDLAFRIRYKLNGKEKFTPHIGKLRVTAAYKEMSGHYDDPDNYLVLSYKRV